MFSSGNATIFVSDMDRAVSFYTNVLGLKLAQRYGNHWASIECGKLTIGLHPSSDANVAGKNGSTVVGLQLSENIDEAVSKLKGQGVKFRGDIAQDNAGRTA